MICAWEFWIHQHHQWQAVFIRENTLDLFPWFLSLRHGLSNLCCSFCSLVFEIIIKPFYLGSSVHPLQMNQCVIIKIVWAYLISCDVAILQSKEPIQCFGYHQHFSKNHTNSNAQKGDGFVNPIGNFFAKNLTCLQLSLPSSLVRTLKDAIRQTPPNKHCGELFGKI